jgi:hypothetical protein
MSWPHRSIWVVRVFAALAATCLLVACSSEPKPKPKPKSNAELSHLLLTDATAPDGFYAAQLPTHGDFDSPASWIRPTGLTCDDLESAVYVLREDPARQIYGVANTMLLSGTDTKPPWDGFEWLVSYQPGGAQRALSTIRSVAGKCPTWHGLQFSVKPGPKVGDDSLEFVADNYLRNEMVLVRISDSLLVVEAQFLVTPSITSQFDDLVESAVAVYQKG